MNRIVRILMERDDMTEEDAMEMYSNCREEITNAISMGDLDLAEDIMMYDLCLEPDYFFDILI